MRFGTLVLDMSHLIWDVPKKKGGLLIWDGGARSLELFQIASKLKLGFFSHKT